VSWDVGLVVSDLLVKGRPVAVFIRMRTERVGANSRRHANETGTG
jgi:hypothetical protein